MTKFDEATQAIKVDEGTYDVCLDPGYGIGGPLNGGYLMAVLLRAAVDASPFEHPVSTTAQFLKAPVAGPAQVRIEPLKAGRTAAFARATLVQDGVAHIEGLITTATLHEVEPDYAAAPAHDMPPREECAKLPDPKPESGMLLNAQMELYFDPPTIGWLSGRPTGRPEARAYFRMAEPQDPDPYVLALAVDALPPVVFSAGARGWAPTVDLTWHLRALPAPGWLTLLGGGRLISDGWFDEEVEVRDSAGRLVAQSRQLARVGRG
ncbi:thioesterase family protein [Nonomuraea phyllanthi]|uniref:Thioesterase family protein n=1 Tax=Nonomuraea phyllanthi TaxID=2219224 RepID=A0A5C4WUC1_9ACTN|nr:thioesterase family protein [Nonomuraea phyllanthi]KAB8197197.1 thioesterase family protein [Nonomuraea phyllanthi]QFY06805.1 thioesterase family protein [Nonomuraea phyllanthi]